MNRNGSNPHKVYGNLNADSLDPSLSPDGKRILFAYSNGNDRQLNIINANSVGLTLVNSSFYARGRSDQSPDGSLITAYSEESWHREIYIMNADGSNLH
jgi:Tol biopolymer transport system component